MLKAIIFDLDDTLLWDKKSVAEAFKSTCELAGTKYDINPAELEERVRENARTLYASYDTYEFTQMIGINPFEGLWGNFLDEGDSFQRLKEIVPGYRKEAWTKGLKDLGIDDLEFGSVLAKDFPVKRKEKAFVYEDSFSVLDQLKGKYQLLLLTNGSPSLQQTKLELTPEFNSYFDHIVISGAFGKGKPEPAIFAHALELLSVKKEEALMIGDNLNTDILGAVRSGIDSVWVNRHQMEKGDATPTYEITGLSELLPLIRKVDQQ
ncbi:haloacid dehalogenase [Virgibacillus profundi]|uniref:Phosphoserine phosphatase n=1 Tax=Virgibacillus profundi TaxID=2024555 RepID=A0A2A2IF43_9BACI|nr:HAD family hydrolase [Virgibacillus profundi]PAV29703.1 haloacid dehalogenase [Virgibacillus profundi]PXY53875.1 HAD family hydrolase [Virgibacillus profundi]